MSTNGHYKDHPLAAILPMMEPSEIKELSADILANGLRAPITLYENKILDGRNRYRACAMVNVEPKIRHFTAGDPVAFIVSANVHRRHLTESQRALVAAKLADLKHGDVSRISQQTSQSANLHLGKTQAKAAEELSVSRRSVATAKTVLREAPKKDIAAIERGEKTVSGVAKEIKQKAAKPEKPVARLDKTGYVIPETILEDWDRADETSRWMLASVSALRSELKKAKDETDPVFAEVTNSTIADLNNAYTSLKCVVPYAVCTSCQGRSPKKCSLCRGRGFVSEFAWRSYVPAEMKAIREAASKKK